MKEPLIVNPYLYLPEQYPIQPDDIVVSRHMNKYYKNTNMFTDVEAEQPARLAFQIAKKFGFWMPISLTEATESRKRRQLGRRQKGQTIDINPRFEHLTSRNLMVEIYGKFWFTHFFIVSAMMSSVPKIGWAFHEDINSDKKLYPIRPDHIDTEKSFSTDHVRVLSDTLMKDARIVVRVCQKKGLWGRIHRNELIAENEEMTGRSDFFVDTLIKPGVSPGADDGMLKQIGKNVFLPTRKLVLWSFLENPKGNWFSAEEDIRARSTILAD